MGKNANLLVPHTSTIIEKYVGGKTTIELATEYGCTSAAVWHLLKRNDAPIRDRSHSARKFTADFEFFDVIDTPNKAYVLGLLFADGCNHQQTNRVILTLVDGELVQSVATAMGATNVIEVVEGTQRQTKYTLRISSAHMCEQLTRLGCVPRKSLIAVFPSSIPDNLSHHFIRGYFDGDGSFYLGGRRKSLNVSICGTSQFLEELLRRCPVEGGRIRRHSGIYELAICRHDEAMKFGDYIYQDDAALYLERKHSIWLTQKLTIRPERSRFDADTIARIKTDYASGLWKQATLGTKYGTSQSHIQRLLQKP
jgi:intein-encoded DNA endonuclease-like protein